MTFAGRGKNENISIMPRTYELRHEKTCLGGFWPGKTQTGLLSYRDKLES